MNEILDTVEEIKDKPRRALKPRMIKIKALRDFLNHEGQMILAGQETEVPPDLADLLLMPIEGPYDFSGYRPEMIATRAKIVRAEVVGGLN